MKSITNLMAWGIRVKNRKSSKTQRTNFSIWINKPVFDVETALETLADPLWQWNANEDRSGKVTRLVVFVEPSAEKSEIPVDIAVMTKLRAIRAVIETGEAPSVDGQPHGKRSTLGESAEDLFEDYHSLSHRPNMHAESSTGGLQ